MVFKPPRIPATPREAVVASAACVAAVCIEPQSVVARVKALSLVTFKDAVSVCAICAIHAVSTPEAVALSMVVDGKLLNRQSALNLER